MYNLNDNNPPKTNLTDDEMALINLLVSGDKNNVKIATTLLKPVLKYPSQRAFLGKFGYDKLGFKRFCDFYNSANKNIYLTNENKDYFYLPMPPFKVLFVKNKYKYQELPKISHLKFETLHCTDTKLSTLPDLPDSLLDLYCEDSKLTSLPKLPNNLKNLECNNNRKLSLNDVIFPQSLETLSFSSYQISKKRLLELADRNIDLCRDNIWGDI